MSSILADLQKAIAGKADKVPKDFLTMRQIAEQEGHDTSWAKKAMAKLLAAGLWEEKPYKIVTGAGLRSVPHYRRK